MDAQLMGAAGQRLEFQPGDRRLAPAAAPFDAPARLRRQAGGIDLHPPAARRVEPAERPVDQALLGPGAADDDRPIGLGDLALLEQQAELFQRLVMAPEHQAARGVAVEAMGERGLARQAEAQGVEIVFEIGAALGAAMHRDPRGLVEDQHQAVAIEQPRSCFFGRHGVIARPSARARAQGEEDIRVSDTGEEKAKSGLAAAPVRSAAKPRLPRRPIAAEPAAPEAKLALAPHRRAVALVLGDLRAASPTSSPSASSTPPRSTTSRTFSSRPISASARRRASARRSGSGRYDKAIEPDEVKAILAAEVERMLEPVARPLVIDATKKPFVILVVGVNGSGKTTTIGKLAAKFAAEGLKVTLAAGDTFRAAAIEQLKIWAARDRRGHRRARAGRRRGGPRLRRLDARARRRAPTCC